VSNKSDWCAHKPAHQSVGWFVNLLASSFIAAHQHILGLTML